MSEYNHDMFPCDMPANTPKFDKGYVGIKWNDEHDDLGRVVKVECECLQWGMVEGERHWLNSKGEWHNKACEKCND